LTQGAAPGRLFAQRLHIECAIDVNNGEAYRTNAQGVTAPGGQRDGTFCSLSSMGLGQNNGGRLLMWRFQSQTDLGFTFRWKLPSMKDSIIRVTLFAQDWDGGNG
jgi:hypothetical protein